MAVWTLLYYAAGGLIFFHKCLSCACPTFVGIFNIWFWIPRSLIEKKRNEMLLAGAVPMFMLQVASYLYILVSVLLLVVQHWTILLLFPITRLCCNVMYRKITKITNSSWILPIMLVANSAFERLHAMSALSMTDLNPLLIAITLDWIFTLRSFIIIVAPIEYQEGTWRERLLIISRFLKLSGTSAIKRGNIVKEKLEDEANIRTRAGHTYYYLSECVNEILTPFVYVLYYYTISGTSMVNAIAGFDDSGALGRNKINGKKLLDAAVTNSVIDFVIFGLALFFVHGRFKKFNPVSTMAVFVSEMGIIYPISFLFPFLLLVSYDFIGTNSTFSPNGFLQ